MAYDGSKKCSGFKRIYNCQSSHQKFILITGSWYLLVIKEMHYNVSEDPSMFKSEKMTFNTDIVYFKLEQVQQDVINLHVV